VWETAVVQQALHDLVQHLPGPLRYVVVARYGLNSTPPATYRQIGIALGLSGERARQLHTEALAWLRHPAHSYALHSLLERHTLADYQTADVLAQRWLRRRGRCPEPVEGMAPSAWRETSPWGAPTWKRIYHRARNAAEGRNSAFERWGLKRLPVYGDLRGKAFTVGLIPVVSQTMGTPDGFPVSAEVCRGLQIKG